MRSGSSSSRSSAHVRWSSRGMSVFISLLVSTAGAVTDLGGIGGPIAGGGSLPLDGDGDVDAEGTGEDRGGQIGEGT